MIAGISLGISLLTIFSIVIIRFNEIKHLKIYIKEIRKNIKRIYEKMENNAERISKIEGRLNGKN